MTDSSIPFARQPDAFSPPVVARLAQLPYRVVLQWPVAVHSLPGQAVVVLRNGIAIVCDNQTYLNTELDAFRRVTFSDDTHASVRLSLKKVDVEFPSAAEAGYFRTAVTDRVMTAPPSAEVRAVRSKASSMTANRYAGATMTTAAQQPVGVPGLMAPILFGLAGAWWASNRAANLGVIDTNRYWVVAVISTGVAILASLLVPALMLLALSAALS